MIASHLFETQIDASLKRLIDAVAVTFSSVDEAEVAALSGVLVKPLRESGSWRVFRKQLATTVDTYGYTVVRGLESDGGRSLLIASSALDREFDTYRPGRIVKRFRMSPWTTELSHTTRAGEFHTDGNVSACPPIATATQCECKDPGVPEYSEQRVAYLPDLIRRLESGTPDDRAALALLTEAEVALVHERSPAVWRGRLVNDGLVRFHPQSLRAAQRRFGVLVDRLEAMLAAIHDAALAVSVPFHTSPGDILFVSNCRALHYRGACSVRFTTFPAEFESRSVLVLHLKQSRA